MGFNSAFKGLNMLEKNETD